MVTEQTMIVKNLETVKKKKTYNNKNWEERQKR